MSLLDDIQLTFVRELADVEEMMRWLGERREFLGVDIETTGFLVGHDYIRLCQFGDSQRGFALDYRDWRGVCREVIAKYDRPVVAHNLLFDSKFLRADGITIPQRLAHDSMIMTHLANPAANMGLKSAAVRYVDKRAKIGQGLLEQTMREHKWTFATVPTDVPAYWVYAALDTCLSAMLAERLYAETLKDPYELELAVIHCLREAEIVGLQVDHEYRVAALTKLQGEIDALRPQVPLRNPGSAKQIIKYLWDDLGARWDVRTDKGNLSTKKNVLEWLADNGFPIARTISQYNGRVRMRDNYLRKMANTEDGGLAVDGILRASTKPVGARTGRMSVEQPPLQQLPRGRVARDAIVAREGTAFVMADFSGMEMRALASLANETAMLEAFHRGEDIHDFAANLLFGPGFTKENRYTVKGTGFGKIYGAGIPTMAATAKTSIEAMTVINATYDRLFPGIKRYLEETTRMIYEQCGGNRKGYGYVELQDGRRLPVEADKAYVAVNWRIQGGCAVTMKRKIVELDAAGLGPYFRLPVHDELIFEVPFDVADDAKRVIERVMPDHHDWPGITLEIDTDVVSRWGEHFRGDYPVYVPTTPSPWLVQSDAEEVA